MGPRTASSSTRKTTAQAEEATRKRLPLIQATSTPTARAATPDHTLWVALTMAGKVMAARVT